MTAHTSPQSVNREGRAGFSMTVVLVLFLFLGIVGGSLCSVLSEAGSSGVSRLNSAKAYYIAHSGLQWYLRNRSSYSGDVSFGGGTLSLVQKNYWRYEVKAIVGDTERRVRGYRSLEYFPGTRDPASPSEGVEFHVQNQTGYWIDFDSLEIEWSGSTAYYGKILMTEDGETGQITVWDKSWFGGRRAGSGEKVSIYFTRWVEPGETIQLTFEDFDSGRYGGVGQDMSAVPIKLRFYDGSYNYQFTVVGVDG